MKKSMLTIGWFSTGRDAAARDLLKVVQENIERGDIKARIEFVFSNREPGESRDSDLFFDLVRSSGMPLVCVSSRKFGRGREDGIAQGGGLSVWRIEYDRAVMARLAQFQPDLCVLAGYMLVVGAGMCQRYKMINLHPAAPAGPTGTWQEVIWQLIEARAETTGVMMHLVTPELDKGPPVAYCTFSLRGEPFDEYWKQEEKTSVTEVKAKEGEANQLFQLIRRHGLAREFPLIVATLKAFSEGRITIDKGSVLDRQGTPIPAYDLTEEIDKMVKGALR